MPSITIWTRLEPRCRSNDMTAALEARTHDPLWMLARQWQLGELLGDDAGSPIVAEIETVDVPIDRYQDASGVVDRVPAPMPLEAWLERESVRPRGSSVDYRQAAEAGLHFLRLLRAATAGKYVLAYVTRYAIAMPAEADRPMADAAALRLLGVVAGRVPDGVHLAADLRAALPSALPAAPAIPAADAAGVLQVAKDFLAWYDALFDEPMPTAGTTTGVLTDQPSHAWVAERMEYRFAIDASATDAPGAFAADHYTGEPLDWTSFDLTASSLGAVTAPPPTVVRRMLPAPVRFKGMPARRFWEIEDAAVDIGAIDAGPADLGRLMLREFALIYGNDWFVVPLPVRVGSVCRIASLVLTDTFGGTHTIPHYANTADGGRWRMFAVTGDAPAHRLLLPPVLARGLTGDAVEQVLLVRDEPANMAWGIERVVQGASGAPIDRASVAAAAAPTSSPPGPGGAPLHYHLGTSVPEYFIPFVPVATNELQRRMRRAAFLRTDGSARPIAPLGRLLSGGEPMFEEEFAREGARVERRYRLARWTDGSTHLWVARRKEIGATTGSSGLRFDRVDDE